MLLEKRLLIVPYGIETIFNYSFRITWLTFNRTLWNWNFLSMQVGFWIRPTFNRTLWNWNIVSAPAGHLYASFNRTLWNWNNELNALFTSSTDPFNRTLWNWNNKSDGRLTKDRSLLIVPYGIETRRAWCENVAGNDF